jgi:hypothetical protein
MVSQINYSEAEIQWLIVLIELAEPISTPNNNHIMAKSKSSLAPYDRDPYRAARYLEVVHPD